MVSPAARELLKSLPQVEEVMRRPAVAVLTDTVPRHMVVAAARDAIDAVRARIIAGQGDGECFVSEGAIVADTVTRVLALRRPSLRRVINASGVIVHTNLGRSVLADAAADAVDAVARGYSTLEYDADAMARGSRHDHCERLICALTGAEAAIAVNNNAAAVMMVLSEFASSREAVVSRGELVEIGGSFRVPDIMALSGAFMREVGTTNKTHMRDYERATTDNTAMYLKVHPSNYRMVGFTESVSVRDLRALADEENARREAAPRNAAEGFSGAWCDWRDVSSAASADLGAAGRAHAQGRLCASSLEARMAPPELLVYEDQGSGALLRLPAFGDYAEPVVADSVEQGADLVSFSGDKLLGGPQAGIIVGKKRLIDRLKANPLARALRLGKMTLAALEATLRLYLDEERALREIPTLRMLSESPDEVRRRAEGLMAAVAAAVPAGCAKLSVERDIARAGGGALPMCDIPTYVVRVAFERGDAMACERHMVAGSEVPVVPRIRKEALLLDARTILAGQECEVASAVADYFAQLD